jgi:hypothetical protein
MFPNQNSCESRTLALLLTQLPGTTAASPQRSVMATEALRLQQEAIYNGMLHPLQRSLASSLL